MSELRRLATLLDQALDLAPAERSDWLGALPADDAALAVPLREMLQADASAGGPGALLDQGPGFPAASAADGVAFEAGEQVGPYRLQRRIGQGGMGEVWLAERIDGSLRRPVALKLPTLGLRRGVLVRRFARERDILGALSHPNIARLYDAGLADDGQPYLALEYVQGERIDAYCDAQGLDARQRVLVMQQVLAAVQFAHANLVVHRDLKPSNVLVTPDGHAMLLDFGIAKLLLPEEKSAAETELTRLGGRALTPDYAAPEQVRGDAVSIATDVWTLGVLLHRLLAGELPFRGANRTELEQAILSQDAPRPSQAAGGVARRLPRLQAAELDNIVGKALRKLPAERYATVYALAEDLTRWLTGQPVSAQTDRWTYRVNKFVARNRLVVLTASIGLAAVLATAVVALEQARQAREQAALAGAQAERARQEAVRAQAVQDFLLDIFRTNSRLQADPQAAQRTTARELLDRGAERVDEALAATPEARLQVLGTLADMYFQIGQRQRAQELEERRVAVARQALRADDPRRADALLALARHLYDGPARETARALLAEARVVLDAAGDHDSPVRGALLTQAARFHRHESLRESIASAESALEFERRHPGKGHALIRAHLMAGTAHLSRLDLARAEPLLAGAHGLARQRGDDRAAALIVPAAELADVWLTTGRIADAEHVLREAIAASQNINGPGHGVTIVLRSQLVYLLLHTGQTAEGLVLDADVRHIVQEGGERFLPSWRRNLDFLLSRNALELGRPALALPALTETIESLQVDMPAAGVLAQRLRMLADVYTALGRPLEAEQRLARAEAIWARYAVGVDEPWARLGLLHARGRVLLAQGRVDEAIAVLQQMPAARLPPGATLDIHALRRDVALAEAWLAKADPGRADALARSVLDRLAALPAPYRLPHLEALAWRALALSQRDAGDRTQARTSLERAVRLRQAHDLPGSVWLDELRQLQRALGG